MDIKAKIPLANMMDLLAAKDIVIRTQEKLF
jgi:hypothetical protein